jgi:hypothetical protein
MPAGPEMDKLVATEIMPGRRLPLVPPKKSPEGAAGRAAVRGTEHWLPKLLSEIIIWVDLPSRVESPLTAPRVHPCCIAACGLKSRGLERGQG